MQLLEFLRQPWPWYVAGPLIGLTVPALLLIGNKSFGISSSLRHICAACLPAGIPFFQYQWKREAWNLFFVGGIAAGGAVAALALAHGAVSVHPALASELAGYGITDYSGMVPVQLFAWEHLFSARGLMMTVAGGFLIGFGTRYAGGCTSGHSIMGLSTLQWPSLVATCCFMAGGILMANVILPFILAL
ncbi:MAG: YeeE/YedE thiosulfate transporter family protein [Bacteroidia bacterium]|nr:YeeE/YedE thiosulfate transporter family protein [Bacteroidia bacterium]